MVAADVAPSRASRKSSPTLSQPAKPTSDSQPTSPSRMSAASVEDEHTGDEMEVDATVIVEDLLNVDDESTDDSEDDEDSDDEPTPLDTAQTPPDDDTSLPPPSTNGPSNGSIILNGDMAVDSEAPNGVINGHGENGVVVIGGEDATDGGGVDGDGVNPSSKILKPKKVKKARTPSPPPPPPPRPRQTIRLNIALGGPSNYEVFVDQLAIETGQRELTPPPEKGSDSDSDSEDEGQPPLPPPPPIGDLSQGIPLPSLPSIELSAPKPVKKKRRRLEYDLDDPFIDDSELLVDAPTHIAQTKQQGFYVSSGDVALVKDKTPKKERAKPKSSLGGPAAAGVEAEKPQPSRAKGPTLTALLLYATVMATAPDKVPPTITDLTLPQAMNGVGVGTRESPIALMDDEDGPKLQQPSFTIEPDSSVTDIKMDIDGPPAAKKMKTETGIPLPTATSANGLSIPEFNADGTTKKRKLQKDELKESFHPEVREELTKLQAAAEAASWAQKGKFPPNLKPILQNTATVALKHGDYNDHFFDYLPNIFPYNRFTMMKLTSKLMFQEHQAFITMRTNVLLDEIKAIATENFEQSQEEFAKACKLWDEKQARKAGSGLAVPAESNADGEASNSRAGSPSANANDGSDAENTKTATGGERKREEKPPQQRFKWNADIKARVWALVHLSNENCRITTQMHSWDQAIPLVTEQTLRKDLYKKIISAFPEGWMNSQTISREVSNMKIKLRKEEEAATVAGNFAAAAASAFVLATAGGISGQGDKDKPAANAGAAGATSGNANPPASKKES